MSQPPLMPKATAVWLVENTALTFQQIADFCQLHELEVRASPTAMSRRGSKVSIRSPAASLPARRLEKAEADKNYRMKILESKVALPATKSKKGPRYTPVSRRQDRPDAIARRN